MIPLPTKAQSLCDLPTYLGVAAENRPKWARTGFLGVLDVPRTITSTLNARRVDEKRIVTKNDRFSSVFQADIVVRRRLPTYLPTSWLLAEF